MEDEKEKLVQQLLDIIEEFFTLLAPNLSLDRLSSDITVAQLRVLLGLGTLGPSSMSSLAAAAGIVPSTATGIVDNLVGKGLVLRDPDPEDRRRVICKLSPEGEEVINNVWTWGRAQIGNLLEKLTVSQLRASCEGGKALLASTK
ncbi:MAG: MarR family transcriptional regulator [Dehalococcoidia bacterium]